MPNIYCPSCAQATKFTFDKPKTCKFCGENYVKVAVVVKKHEKLPKKTDFIEDLEEEDEEVEYVPIRRKAPVSLAGIKVVVDKPEVSKFGNIVGTDMSGEEFSRPKMDKNTYLNKVFKSSPASFE